MGVCLSIPGQVIEFESNGLKYQTITKRGLTLMVAQLPGHVREFTILQVAVSNGSPGPYTIRPEDFSYKKDDGTELHAWPARDVVQLLREKGGRGDVMKLVSAYETALYGIPHMKRGQRVRVAAAGGTGGSGFHQAESRGGGLGDRVRTDQADARESPPMARCSLARRARRSDRAV
jgi:hypothetical protein